MLSVSKFTGYFATVAVATGFSSSHGASISVSVGRRVFAFSTGGTAALARDNTAAIAAFKHGLIAVARSPDPNHRMIVDQFSLRGFSAAYATITRACRG